MNAVDGTFILDQVRSHRCLFCYLQLVINSVVTRCCFFGLGEQFCLLPLQPKQQLLQMSANEWYNVVRELNNPLQQIFAYSNTNSTFARVTADAETFNQFWNGETSQEDEDARFVVA